MAVPYYSLQVVTPAGVVYEGKVRHARVPVENGSVGVLANHAPYVTSSAGGPLIIDEENGSQNQMNVGEGFFSVAYNKALFLTSTFQAAKT